MKLRKYQIEAIEKALPYLEKSNGKVLISMPQGTGKTAIIVNLLLKYLQSKASIYSEKILIIVDRKSLLNQLKKFFQETFDDINIITDNLSNYQGNTPFLIQSLQSLTKDSAYQAIDKYTLNKIVFFDCERLGVGKVNSPVQNIINHFEFSLHIGIDGFVEKSIRYFGKPIFEYSMQSAINDNVLLDYRVTYIQLKKEEPEYWSSVNDITELDETAFEYFYGGTNTFKTLAKSILENINDEKTVIFCKFQEYADRLSKALNAFDNKKTVSKVVTSKIPQREIHKTLLEFRENNTTNILLTVDLLATGIDLPCVRHIVFLRDFGSNTQLFQILANYSRPFENKEFLHVIDFVGIKSLNRKSVPIEKEITIEPEESTIKEPLGMATISKTDILFKDKNSLEGVLGVNDLADEFSQIIIKMPYEQGRMIGIFGKWGRGKTFLFNETWKLLNKTKNIRKVDFHAWKYQDTPAVWAYLYERFANEYYNSSPNSWSKFWRRIKLNCVRLGYWQILWLTISFIISSLIALFIPPVEKFDIAVKILSSLTLSVVLNITIIYFRFKNSAIELFHKYYSKKTFTNLLGIQAEVQKELISLIKSWSSCVDNIRIILFVDDVDRCSEDKIISIVDSLRVMLDDDYISSKLIVVTAIDERILKRAIRLKYQDIVGVVSAKNNSEIESNNLVSEYLDKLFITGIKLGTLIPEEKDEFFIELTKDDRENENTPSFNNINSLSEKEISEELDDIDLQENYDLATENGDFMIKDGDLGLENEAGKIKSSSKIIKDKFLEENKSALSQVKKISDEEINIVRKKIQLLKEVTPRQIRVFYYRYLIAKNLLLRQYSKIERKNIWISSHLNEFIELLILFSMNNSKQSIALEREKILNLKEPRHKIEFLNDIEVDRNDYLVLLCALDTVIGY